jgi:hypothetical protein
MLFATLGGYPGQGYSGDAQAGPKGLGAFTDAISRQDFKLLRTNWLDELWGQFSWLTVSLPHWAHVVLALFMGVLAVAGVALVARTVIDLARARRSPEPSRSADPAEADLSVNTGLVLLAVVLTFGGLLFLMWQYFHQMGRFDLIQGRYALMVVPALLALPALFGRRFAPRLSPVVPMSAVAVLMAILHVTAVGVVVNAFYY